MICDLNTFISKAVPDTRLTLKKYLDVKFEYLVRRVTCGAHPDTLGRLSPGEFLLDDGIL